MHVKSVLALCVIGVVLSAGAVYAAVAAPVPEINPGSVSAGIALLAGGVLLVRALRK
jgi:hypothetical protein